MAFSINSGNGFGQKTATAGTRIRRLIPPLAANTTRLNKFKYRTTGTAHTATVLRSIGSTYATTAANAGQADVIVAADPGPAGNGIAAGDLIAIRTNSDGITRLYVVSSWASVTRAITFTTNLTVAVAVRDMVWDFGVESDTDPVTGEAQQAYGLPAATNPQETTYEQDTVGINASNNVYEPLLISVDNATNAGVILETVYTQTVP